jgi:3-oxoacyl-(acyl-carrier-protein) synthase
VIKMAPEINDPNAKLKKAITKLIIANKQVEALQNQIYEPIAIIGMACRFPGGANSPELFWKNLVGGIDSISEVPRERWSIDDYYSPDKGTHGKMYVREFGFIDEIDQFDADFFNISPKEAILQDPQHRLLLEVAWEAIESACIPQKKLRGSQTGVFVGLMIDDYLKMLTRSGGDDSNKFYTALGNVLSTAAGRISFTLGLEGPCIAIDTACSSSLVTTHLGCQSLRVHECDLALVGGVNLIIDPETIVSLCDGQMLSPNGRCKTFDAGANGYGRGEGCGMLLLKRLSDAKRDSDQIFAIIRGSAINQDGASGNLTVPNGVSQKKLIQKALEFSKVLPGDVDYFEAHGTGTPLGDPIEINAISNVMSGKRIADHPLLIGTVKTNIGHLEAAAGVASLIKVILSLQHQMIPRHLHLEKLNPNIDLSSIPALIPQENIEWKKSSRKRIAEISAFSINGINAHVVMEEAPEKEVVNVEVRPLYILTLSAKTEPALSALVDKYVDFLDLTTANLGDICYSANTGRNHERYRIAAIAKDFSELKTKLVNKDYAKGEAKEVKSYALTDINELAKAYVNGAEIDWVKFDAPYHRQKVILPSYPFQRKRYWAKALDQEIKINKLDQWFYRIKWREAQEGKNSEAEQNFLVFASDEIFKNLFSKIKSQRGDSSSKISKDVTDVVYCSDFEKGCDGLLVLVQRIVQSGLQPKLWVLAKNAQVVTGNEKELDISKSPLFGLSKVIALEYPELHCVRIDYDHSLTPEKLMNELHSTGKEDEIAIRESKRYVPRIEKYEPLHNKALSISKEGSYLITGGLGGLGLACAEWLIEKGAKNLILSGRSKPKEEVQKKIDAYQKQGINITVALGDISKKADVDSLFTTMLKGIIHAAGIADSELIINQSIEKFNQVLAPKVTGTENISDAIKFHQLHLDFFVLFSSVSGVLGSQGTSSYTAANYYLDQYAKREGLPAISIAWGPWASVGMAAGEEERELRLGYKLITPSDGIRAMEMALSDDETSPIIMPVNWEKYFANLPFIGNIYSNFQRKAASDDLGVALDRAKPSDRSVIAREHILKAFRDVLGLEKDAPFDETRGFYDAGMDSLMAVEFRNRLQASVGDRCVLTSTLTFDYPNIEKVVDHILIQLGFGEIIPVIVEINTDKLIESEIIKEINELSIDEIRNQLEE